MTTESLIAAARAAAAYAYAPYSRFAVGAALRLEDGSIITGCNFENASYGLSLCAETVALASANSAGRLAEVVEVAVIGGRMAPEGLADAGVVTPCGRCRQMLNEVGHDLLIHCASVAGVVASHQLSALLPHAFGPANLGETA